MLGSWLMAWVSPAGVGGGPPAPLLSNCAVSGDHVTGSQQPLPHHL